MPAASFPVFRPTLVLLALMSAVLGGVYPLCVTLAAQGLFPAKAQGSLIVRGDAVIGSKLLGQEFTSPRYFWSRPSATLPPYNASASAGSQLAASNPLLRERVAHRAEALRKAGPASKGSIPVDLVTASASGLDPHISPAAAEYQVSRVAHARGMKEREVRSLVKRHTSRPQFDLLGQPRVNVLELNLALDKSGGG